MLGAAERAKMKAFEFEKTSNEHRTSRDNATGNNQSLTDENTTN